MEARSAFRGSAISKRMVVVVAAVLVALMLGGLGGYLVKTMGLPTSAVVTHTAVGQPDASGFGSAWNYSDRRGGNQSLEGPAPTASPTGASFREPTTGRSGPQS
jgi:hypothetical protein